MCVSILNSLISCHVRLVIKHAFYKCSCDYTHQCTTITQSRWHHLHSTNNMIHSTVTNKSSLRITHSSAHAECFMYSFSIYQSMTRITHVIHESLHMQSCRFTEHVQCTCMHACVVILSVDWVTLLYPCVHNRVPYSEHYGKITHSKQYIEHIHADDNVYVEISTNFLRFMQK